MHNAREVYWVPLGAVVEPTEVAAAVAKGIGISAHGQLHSERRRYFGWLISHLGCDQCAVWVPLKLLRT
jgi:hypothetical protein